MCGPLFEQTWIPFTQGYFVPSLVEIGPVILEKKMKMWKVYRQTDGRTDDRQQVIRKAHLSFQLRWAKNPECLLEKQLQAKQPVWESNDPSYEQTWLSWKKILKSGQYFFSFLVQVYPLGIGHYPSHKKIKFSLHCKFAWISQVVLARKIF